MSDTTWRDEYGDAEGMACTLDIWSRVFAKQGNYGQAIDMSAAATALREQAERIATLENDYVQVCDLLANRRRQVSELEAENEQLKAQLATARALLAEAADEIECETENEYAGKLHWPDELRRYERDMDLPRRIRQALDRAQAAKETKS